MHNCEDTPYITRMQMPLDISQTLTVLSADDDAMYWLFDEKSKSEIYKWRTYNSMFTMGLCHGKNQLQYENYKQHIVHQEIFSCKKIHVQLKFQAWKGHFQSHSISWLMCRA